MADCAKYLVSIAFVIAFSNLFAVLLAFLIAYTDAQYASLACAIGLILIADVIFIQRWRKRHVWNMHRLIFVIVLSLGAYACIATSLAFLNQNVWPPDIGRWVAWPAAGCGFVVLALAIAVMGKDKYRNRMTYRAWPLAVMVGGVLGLCAGTTAGLFAQQAVLAQRYTLENVPISQVPLHQELVWMLTDGVVLVNYTAGEFINSGNNVYTYRCVAPVVGSLSEANTTSFAVWVGFEDQLYNLVTQDAIVECASSVNFGAWLHPYRVLYSWDTNPMVPNTRSVDFVPAIKAAEALYNITAVGAGETPVYIWSDSNSAYSYHTLLHVLLTVTAMNVAALLLTPLFVWWGTPPDGGEKEPLVGSINSSGALREPTQFRADRSTVHIPNAQPFSGQATDKRITRIYPGAQDWASQAAVVTSSGSSGQVPSISVIPAPAVGGQSNSQNSSQRSANIPTANIPDQLRGPPPPLPVTGQSPFSVLVSPESTYRTM